MLLAKLGMVALQFQFLVPIYIASVSTSLQLHLLPSPHWPSVQVLYHDSVSLQSFIQKLFMKVLDLAVPCINSQSEEQLVVAVPYLGTRISISRFHTLDSYIYPITLLPLLLILYALLSISLLSSLKFYISLLLHLSTKVVS